MAIDTTTNKTIQECNGALTGFVFTFPITSANDLQVIMTHEPTGIEQTLALTTNYTVTPSSNDYADGGTVTTVATWSSDYTITIYRSMDFLQSSDFTENMPTLYETFENGLDKLAMEAQQLNESVNRTIRIKKSDVAASLELPLKADRASKYLAFNGDGEPIVATGTPQALNPLYDNYYLPDYLAADQGLTVASNTIKYYVDLIGATNKATIYLRHNSGGANTDYTFSNNETIPSNITLKFENGARLLVATGVTVTINGGLGVGLDQIFSCIGTGSVVLSSNSSDSIYSVWWKENTIPGTTDMSEAIQAAAKAAWISGIPLCITGIQRVDTGVVVGNTAEYASGALELFGLPGAKLLTTNNITIFTVQGQNPEFDGAGNRVQGGYIHDLAFSGNSTQGTGLKYYGVQNVRIERLNIQHFDIGIYLHNCDLISINNSFITYNVSYGIGSEGSGYAASGTLDSFWLRDSTFANNGIGVDYAGGTSPNFIGNKFVLNGTDIRLGYHALRNYVAVAPTIIGNNFENTTTNNIFLGGGGGIVRAGDISKNTFFGSSGITDIYVSNVLPGQIGYSWLRIHDNLHLNTGGTIIGGYTGQVNFTDNSTVNSLSMNYTKASGDINHGKLYTTTFALAAAGAKNILRVTPYGQTTNGILYIRAAKYGKSSSRMYYVNIIGAGAPVATWTPISSVNYTGGGVYFTVTETSVSGTNIVTINNTEATDELEFIVRYHAVDSNATFEP